MTNPAQSVGPRPEARVYGPGGEHWVGDGFFVRTVFDPSRGSEMLSPFLLLDFAARRIFEPSVVPRGVGEHPHRGFETVTFAYAGEIEHRDSSGGGGRIGPGGVQWMTAARGVVHEEMHSRAFSARGGAFEMAQLWVNLPAADKMGPPGYQSLVDQDFPRVDLGVAKARLVAGWLAGARGPAETKTPMTLFDVRFGRGGDLAVALPEGWTKLAVALEGEVHAGEPVPPAHLAVFPREEGGLALTGSAGSRVLVLAGQPLGEPVVAYGPFVMSTREEIVAAHLDYQAGKMGHL